MDVSLSRLPGVSDGQGGLVCCGSWGHKESDTTERLNWTELKIHSHKDSASWQGIVKCLQDVTRSLGLPRTGKIFDPLWVTVKNDEFVVKPLPFQLENDVILELIIKHNMG